MSPPLYADLGKSAKDLFQKGYNFGFLKLDTKTYAGEKSDIEFKTATSHNVTSGKLYGTFDVKYKIPDYGVTFTEKWNTDNQLGTIVEIEDKFAKGLKLIFDSSYAPQLSKRNSKLKLEWQHENVKVNADMSLDAGPILNLATVAGHQGWLLGFQGTFDTANSKLTATNFSCGRQVGDYAGHAFVNDGTEFGASVYHKVSPNVEIGSQFGWTTGDQSTRYGLAAQYKPTTDLTVRAKINNTSHVAIAATHSLSPKLKLTLSSQFSLHQFHDGGHKVGIGLEYEPQCCQSKK